MVWTRCAFLNAAGTVVGPNSLSLQQASMRGEMAQVWWSPRERVVTVENELGMSDSPN